MTESIDAVVAGHICLDIIPDLSLSARSRPEDLFAPGRLVQAGKAAIATGGPVSNTGLALHRLGLRVRLAAKTGNDLFGRAVREIVGGHGEGLADGLIADERADTSYTVILNPPGVDRIFFHCPGANDAFGADDLDYRVLREARLLHFGYPPVMRRMYANGGRELAELFRRAKETGVTTSLDMTFPDPASDAGRADWVAILKGVLPSVDVFLPSLEEILFLLRRKIYEKLTKAAGAAGLLEAVTPDLLSDLGEELINLGVKSAGVKLGERGLYLRTASRAAIEDMGRGRPANAAAWADRELWAPCFQVMVAGTTGAGDAAIAGFLCALLRDLSPEEAVTAATAVGASCVEAADAVSGIQGWEETLGRIKSGWPRRVLKLKVSGWRFDPTHQLWGKG